MKIFSKAINNHLTDKTEAAVSDYRYKMLFIASRDAIMTLEPPSWKFTSANPATLKMFRAKSEKQFLSYEPWKLSPELQPDGDLSSVKAKKMIDKAMRDGSNLFEWTHKRINGDDFFAEVLLSRVKIGEKFFLNAVVRDITERKKIEMKLQENAEERFRILFNNSSDGILLVDEKTRKFFLANKTMGRMLGYSPEKITELSIPDIHPAESLPYVLDQFDKQLKGKIGIAENIPVLRKDGSVFYADIASSRVVLQGRGYMMGKFRDMTEHRKSQEALILSEQKYRRLFEAAKDGILILDAETGEIREVNPYLIQMLGYSRKEFLQKKLWQIGFFKDVIASKESFEELKSKGYVHYEDLPLRTKAGKAIHVEFVSNVYGIDHTNVVQCNIRDITARYQAEMALANNELRFRAIYENSPVPIFLVGLDGKFLSVNSTSEKMLGYSQKELQKMTFGDITHPDEVKRDIGKIKELISGKIGTYDVEKRYIRKDKQIVYVHIYVTLIRDASKKPLYFLTIAEDVTNHHAYLEKIRQSEIKYSTLVENSNDAVLVIQDGLYVFANKSSETITGYKAKDVLGKPLMDFVAPKYKKMVLDMYTRRMRGEQAASRYEFDIIKKDSSLLSIEVSSSLVEFEGRPAVMAIIRDMTIAKEIDRIKSEFIAVASHQLRTPLTGIKWYSQLLLADKTAPLNETQKDYINGIFDSNERMIKLVNDLLDVSHIETGHKFSVVKKNIDIIAVIKRVAGSNTICNGTCGIKIELDKKMPSRLAVPIDEKKIEQVFINLLSNAIKYSGKGKKIIISANKIDGEAYFSVKDFGLGIPKRQHHLIFQKFFRADNIATTSQEGTGLGLYIAKSIVEAHGGKINFESKENKGTTFYFTLPLK